MEKGEKKRELVAAASSFCRGGREQSLRKKGKRRGESISHNIEARGGRGFAACEL